MWLKDYFKKKEPVQKKDATEWRGRCRFIPLPDVREKFYFFGHVFYCAGYSEDKYGNLFMIVRRRVEERSEWAQVSWPLYFKREQHGTD